MGFLDFLRSIFAKKHIKIGLALGSGGAKGAATLGVIKAFEEQGLKFDVIAGSSIGAMIGAFMASGLNCDDMLGLVEQYGLTDPKKLILYKFRGESVTSILSDMLGEKTFADLELPFAAVAADINTGEEVDIKTGQLSSALAASGAIPPVFRPVGRENRRLIDGAFVNAVPADVVKSMGADVVISVNLSASATNEGAVATLDSMYKGHGVKACDRLRQCRKYSDFTLSPELNDYTAASVDKFYEMYSVGYRCAVDNMEELKKVLQNHGVKI